ncbi:MAG: murein L,D-transpeptidase [Alysiella sp.]|uniref:murein L,D-transpeptidase n=1 Tax=Alysiella sp. TaxID=1872483 RepID=UPI0026DB6055|nr:murein L,D-transpeptidase [Alysiella sp.]MDO4434053.1 murein L,D-transpeptidase [Alysiella sp.]
MGLKALFACAVALVFALPAQADDFVAAFMQSKKVVVDTQKAELCFADTGDCHAVLIGKTTPKGTFPLTIYATEKAGYGGDVIGFKQEGDFLFALHRVWTLKPAERRMERLHSGSIAERIMTNGCINVSDDVYRRLREYFVLEVV